MNTSTQEVGYVTRSNKYLIYLEGLPSVHINSIIKHKSGSRAIVTKLENKRIQALMLDDQIPQPGDSFSLFSDSITLPIDDHILGHVIDPLGNTLDDIQMLKPSDAVSISVNAPTLGISNRKIIDQQFVTGVSTIDSLLPIGLGQRELIIGEPRSGKTAFLYDVISNQKDNNTICIYCAIGKSELAIKGFASSIQTTDAHTYTVIVAAPSSCPAPVISMAPTTAFTIAEYFRDKGKNVFLILDDMGLHAKYVREISLLAEQIPGRDSYPGSIFHTHAQIVERAGNFSGDDNSKSSAITLFPVIEIIPEAFTSYISTNLMSMTDGHLLFSAKLISGGQYPAVDISRSVTRVGRQTQHPLLRALSDKIRALLSRYEDVRTYSRFGSELTVDTVTILKQSELITELLRQEEHQMLEIHIQIMYLTLPFTHFLAQKDVVFVRKYKHMILSALKEREEFLSIKNNLDSLSLDQLINQLNNYDSLLESICR